MQFEPDLVSDLSDSDGEGSEPMVITYHDNPPGHTISATLRQFVPFQNDDQRETYGTRWHQWDRNEETLPGGETGWVRDITLSYVRQQAGIDLVNEYPAPSDSMDETQSHDQIHNPILEDDAFKCPICTEIFAQPKLLPCCRRSICEKCERRMVHESESGNCPMCNSPGQIRRTRVLGVNIDLRNAIEALNKQKPDVTKPACQECQRIVDQDDLCFCATCDREKFICWRCGGKAHKGHDLEELKYVGLEERQRAYDALQRSDCAFNDVKTNLQKGHQDCFEKAGDILDRAKNIAEETLKNNYQTDKEFHEKLKKIEKIQTHIDRITLALKHIHNDMQQLTDQIMEDER
ncbi:hypothetical protein QR680_004151 [Steinernema hermaphroditum]|uniref:RING-type domain-containing protein n=1 Tax=Steinernema hermaphroditum TaxID=289476 RepID=A0AA39HMT1_9BILA|nr:hypothetical protein QR680_004151 [Steinernema hermaphroditum]